MTPAGNAMATILGAWVLLGVMFAGVGFAVFAAGRLRAQAWEVVFAAFWVGWGATILFLQVWHGFFPVSARALVVVAAVGAAGLWAAARDVLRLVLSLPRSSPAWACGTALAAAAGVAVVTANVAIGPNRVWDTGLYHLQVLRWYREYAIVPGLGNLHARLAFDNSTFLYAALLDVGVLHGWRLASGLLLVVFATEALAHVPGLIGRGASHGLALVAMLPAMGVALLDGQPAAVAPDFVLLVLAPIVTAYLLRAVTMANRTDERDLWLFSAAFLAVVGLTVKPSFAPFGVAVLGIAFWRFWRGRRRSRTWRLVVASAVLALASRIARSVVLSGYPLFPLPLGGLALEWRLPHASAVLLWDLIGRWARSPGLVASGSVGTWGWLPGWWIEVAQREWDFRNPAILAVASLAMIAVARAWRRPATKGILPLLVPAPIAVAVWFASAPDIRLGTWIVWTLAATSAAVATYAWSSGGVHRVAVYPLIVLSALWCAQVGRIFAVQRGITTVVSVTPHVVLGEYATATGLVVYVPSVGLQTFDAPLPSTPYPNEHLALRRPGDLSAGFRVVPFDDAAIVGIAEPQVASGKAGTT